MNVLITGETGTGKELVAKCIHSQSPRACNELVSVNCAAIPPDLLEAELFGYKKGSFSGANESYQGLFEYASGGTMFLDEIGDLTLPLQAKLLRILQEKKVRPLGSCVEKVVDFRLVVATHRDLKSEVSEGRFREDLFYRLNVVRIHLPPLRERQEDIAALISTFLEHFSKKYRLKTVVLSQEAIELLSCHAWPGNVRELENLIERITIHFQDEELVTAENLNQVIELGAPETRWPFTSGAKLPTVSELTSAYVQYVVSKVNSHQGEAARILGLSRRTLYRKLNQQGERRLNS